MKMIHCLECEDVVNLVQELRFCQCGKSMGRYLTKGEIVKSKATYNAVYSGPAVVMGIANKEIVQLDASVKHDEFEFFKGEWIYIRPDKTTVLYVKDAGKYKPLPKRAI